jgi:hypothetical protein
MRCIRFCGSWCLLHGLLTGCSVAQRQLSLEGRGGDQLVIGIHVHERHALGIAADHAEVADLHAHHLAVGRDQHERVGFLDGMSLDDLAVALGCLDGNDAAAAAVLGGTPRSRSSCRSRSVQTMKGAFVVDDLHAAHASSPSRNRMPRTPRVARPWSRKWRLLVEANAHALAGEQQHLVGAGGLLDLDQRSPSSTRMAMMPSLRTLRKSLSLVFLTTPLAVAMTR